MKTPWFTDHSNIVELVHWMYNNDYDTYDIVYAVEKPWKYEEEFLSAMNELIGGQQEDEDIEE